MEVILNSLEAAHVVVQFKMTALDLATSKSKMQIPVMKGCGF